MRCLPRLACFLVASFAVLAATPALAAEPDLHAELEIHALHAASDLDGRSLDDSAAYHAADLRLRGAGTFTGGGLRLAAVYLRHLRVGWGADFFAVSGSTLAHAPLGRDLHLDAGTPWGAEIELFGGYAVEFGRLTPYADLRVGAQFVRTSIGVRSDKLGAVQTLTRQIVAPVVAPRLGVKIRLDDWIALDLAWSASPFGVERVSASAGFTFFFGEKR